MDETSIITLSAHALPALGEAVTRADAEGRPFRLALGHGGSVAYKVGEGAWTAPLSLEEGTEPARLARPFTIADSVHLEPIMRAAQSNAHVTWTHDGTHIYGGTVRRLCKPNGLHSDSDSDVRALVLDVTVDGLGRTEYVPVGLAMLLVSTGAFRVD